MNKLQAKRLLMALLLPLTASTFAQKVPEQYYFSPDGHVLHIGRTETSGFYNMDSIQQIHINFPQQDYLTRLTNNYRSMTYLTANMIINGKVKDSVGVRYKGFTSYSLVQGNKKSLDVDLNFVKPNQDIKGYKKLNLHNSYSDPSFMREVFYYHHLRRYSMSAKANFAHVYVNGNNYGLYQNVQQYDKTFLGEWFLSNDGSNWRGDKPSSTNDGLSGPITWIDGNSAFNYKGDDTTAYKALYDLKSSDQPEPWKDLPKVCKILSQSPPSTLEADVAPYLDIDRTLWHLAGEVLFGDDDSYVYKGKMDYYLYQDAETGRFMSYDYDANSTCAPNHYNWSPFYNETRVNLPLMNKLLAVPSLRQRYLAHMRTMFEDCFDPAKSASLIDKYKNLIDSVVSADPIKLSTYTQFTAGIAALKKFISDRRTYLLSNSDFNVTAPSINNTQPVVQGVSWQKPTDAESVVVTSEITHAQGISAATLYYGTGVYGTFTKTQMYDDGQHGDGAAGDGKYGATIPPHLGNTYVRFYVEAAANNAPRSVSYAPKGAEHDVYVYQVKATVIGAANSPVVINEFLASNVTGAQDEAGEYEDWIELHNKSDKQVDLSGYYLSDNAASLQKWQFPQGVQIPAHGYLIVWADENAKQGNTHANFKLSANGEEIILLNKDVQILDSIVYPAQYPSVSYARMPNATGAYAYQTQNTFAANNNGNVTAAEDGQVTHGFMIAPNPAMDHITVLQETPHGILRIYTIAGALVYEKMQDPSNPVIDISLFHKGMYMVHYGSKVGKFIKQ
ncbi:MAG TPA: CotH kinase family protein [Cytophagales bacterium]|nr:CotH kinase family protein [Cytophagales bacterium]